MDKEKIKLIVRNLESLVECLKSEVYSDINSNTYKQELKYEEISPYIDDYDEVFYDDESDELADLIRINQKYKDTKNSNGDVL